jgi:hypothetical protein
MPSPRIGTSLIIACSTLERPNSFAAFSACGLVNFIWPRMAPTIRTSESADLLADVLPGPAFLALDVEQLFGEVGSLHFILQF